MEFVARPTTYNGTRFRSRLEARWAAFFDLCEWRWAYEPADLKGWIPDFSIDTPFCVVYVEVKPSRQVNLSAPEYEKALAHWRDCQILVLGREPERASIGGLADPPPEMGGEPYSWLDVYEYLSPNDHQALWREAGNLTQWRGDRARP